MISAPLLYYGKASPLPSALSLRAGPLIVSYEEGSLRNVRLGNQVILSQIYCAVRDHNWSTIPARLTTHDFKVNTDSFSIRYVAEHRKANIHFIWTATLIGTVDGRITFTMDGQTLSTFRRNRIGFCVLHPMTCAGVACTVEHIDGSVTRSQFPVSIVPHQPFQNIRAITHNLRDGLQAAVCFDGDTFEMEDQRNWTDASYKTYCTPLDLPFPVEVTAGTHIQQSVTLRLVGAVPPVVAPVSEDQPYQIQFTVGLDRVGRLPRLGLSAASHSQTLTPLELQRLRMLNLSHLRVDVHFDQLTWRQRLQHALDEAHTLDLALELALHLTADLTTDLSALRSLLDARQPTIATWLLFRQDSVSTPSEVVQQARHHLASYTPSALFAGGTDAFFAQLNRNRPPMTALDLLSYSLNPQVHAFDNQSLVETLPVQAVTLASARQFSAGKPIMVSPITLKMRFNPAATAPDELPSSSELPSQVDVRQMSLFGTGWTLGSIKAMSLGGAYSVTYYETTGWRGVMELSTGSPLPSQFPSTAGAVFPLYHALADIGEYAGAEVLRSASSDPHSVDGLVLSKGESIRLLLANFTAQAQPVRLDGPQGSAFLRLLDEFTAAEALTTPEIFRAQAGQPLNITNAGLSFDLAPFAVARLDIQPT